MEFTPNVYFDLDSLTQSYNQFFNYQKQQNWEGLLSKPDSVQIQQVFERNVNDMRRMYIRFALPNRYTTNKYETGGIISSEPEKGVYKMDTLKKLLTLIPDGQKKPASNMKVLYFGADKMLLKSADDPMAPTLTCRRVE